jgi:hypothetical protein
MNLKTIVLLLALAAVMFAQTPPITPAPAPMVPNNVAGVGFGFQNAGSPNASGWVDICHRNPDVTILGMTFPSYLCAATDYAQATTSARVDMKIVILTNKWFAGGTQTGGGAAINGNGVGGSYALGGWGALDVSKYIKFEGLHLVSSVTWQKDDVNFAPTATLPQILKQLGSRGTFRFGFAKSW